MAEREKPWFFLPILLFNLFFFFFFFTPIFADDAAIMKKLAGALSPTPSGWSASDPCNWTGVNCDNSNSVTSINLASKSLSGSLPSDLNQLTQLKTLALQNNQLSGALPSLSNLSQLQSIFLDSNNFTSVPPSFLSGLTSLTTLSLSQNSNLSPWPFPKELSGSSSLVTLYISKANLMGSIPDIFDLFQSLQSLRLSYNNLTGSLPPSLAKTSIQNLWLNNQGLSGPIDVIGRMSMVSQLWLHANAFTGPIPDLSQSISLFDLQLRDNQLTGVVPNSLISLTGLQNVSLSNNKLQGPYPDFNKGVQVLLGTTNSFCNTNPGPCDPQVTALLAVAGALGYPMNLADSWAGNDPCQGWTFVSCDSQKKNVVVINFSKQKFAGTISPAIANLTSLRNLILNDNNLTGPIPDALASMSQLLVLDVSNNNLTGKMPVFPSRVTVTSTGNPFLGNDSSSGGNGNNTRPPSSGDSPSGSPSGKGKGNSISAGLIVGIVAAVILLLVVILFSCVCWTKKRHAQKSGRVQSPEHGMEMMKNGIGGTANGYGGSSVNKLSSQSIGSSIDIPVSEGGNVTISIQVLRQVTNNFSEDNILGRGGFGIVYGGKLHDGTQIAVKRMESNAMGTKGLNEFEAEIAVLTKVRHRHLVALLGFCTNNNERLLVYEYMPQGTLGQHLFDWSDNGYPPLTWKQRVTIALDVARGVEYLHSLAQQSFIHRDLKPSNVLLGDDMRAKVSDFGLVKNAPDGKYSVETRLAGTFGYLAPEYAATGRVTTKVDVYAFGVILMELVTGRKTLDESLPDERSHLVTWFRRILINKDNIRKVIDATLDPDDETFGYICTVAELAGHCTAREPSQRPDMGHAVNILGPLVQQWKPTCREEDDNSGIDLNMPLSQALQIWQSDEGTSTMIGDDSSRRTSFENTQSSIPTKPLGFADPFNSFNCR